MRSLTNKQASGPILWIALAVLVLAALGNHLTFKTCVGDCCHDAASMVVAEADTTDGERAGDGHAACCGCCANNKPGNKSEDQARGTCDPGCCITLAFDIEMAPADAVEELPPLPVIAIPVCMTQLARPTPREVRRLRPFDRGPPRIDRCTALRACTVLLI